jgi:sulfite reductase (NADPH) flavoprotein alpha-component
MTLPAWPTVPSILPESAPFTPEQRTWLNGFFAGFLSLDGAVTPLSPEEAAQLAPGLVAPPPLPDGAGDNGDDEETPWHDPAMLLPERLKLAEGRVLRQRLMAAMAQQDCGQCGYNCRDYSNAIFRKQEERLNLCVPGGKENRPDAQDALRRA